MIGFDELFEWLYGHRHSLDSRRDVSLDLRLQLPDGSPEGVDWDGVAWDVEALRVLIQQMLVRARIGPSDLHAMWTKRRQVAVRAADQSTSSARVAREHALEGLRHGLSRTEFIAQARCGPRQDVPPSTDLLEQCRHLVPITRALDKNGAPMERWCPRSARALHEPRSVYPKRRPLNPRAPLTRHCCRETLFDATEGMETLWKEELEAVVGAAADECLATIMGTNFLGRVRRAHLGRWLREPPRVRPAPASSDPPSAQAAAAPSTADTAASGIIPWKTEAQLRRQRAQRELVAMPAPEPTSNQDVESSKRAARARAARARAAIAEAAAVHAAREESARLAKAEEEYHWRSGPRLRWETPADLDRPFAFRPPNAGLRGSTDHDASEVAYRSAHVHDKPALVLPGVPSRSSAFHLPLLPPHLMRSADPETMDRVMPTDASPFGGGCALPYLFAHGHPTAHLAPPGRGLQLGAAHYPGVGSGPRDTGHEYGASPSLLHKSISAPVMGAALPPATRHAAPGSRWRRSALGAHTSFLLGAPCRHLPPHTPLWEVSRSRSSTPMIR